MMADMDKVKEQIIDVVDKIVEKAKEIKDSEKTKQVVEKTKDVAIDVGVKVSDVVEDLASRGQKVMHQVKQNNDAKKEACYDAEIISEEDCEVEA